MALLQRLVNQVASILVSIEWNKWNIRLTKLINDAAELGITCAERAVAFSDFDVATVL